MRELHARQCAPDRSRSGSDSWRAQPGIDPFMGRGSRPIDPARRTNDELLMHITHLHNASGHLAISNSPLVSPQLQAILGRVWGGLRCRRRLPGCDDGYRRGRADLQVHATDAGRPVALPDQRLLGAWLGADGDSQSGCYGLFAAGCPAQHECGAAGHSAARSLSRAT